MSVDKRGRKPVSEIRDNIAELLFFVGEAYGYELFKKYVKVFGQKISMRSVYYHLNKGVELGEFVVNRVENIRGNFTWGEGVRRVVFKLGPNAKPSGRVEVKEKI